MKLELYGCILDPPYSPAFTEVRDPIQSDTTWELNKSPYYVMENIEIESGATLTIEAGVRVVFAQSVGGLVVKGIVNANGQLEKRILFTGYKMIYAYSSFGWRGLLVHDTGKLTLENVDMIQAAVGIEGPADGVRVRGCLFDMCPTGVRLSSGSIDDVTEVLFNTTITNGVVGLEVSTTSEKPHVVVGLCTISYQAAIAIIPRTNGCNFKGRKLTISNNERSPIFTNGLSEVRIELTASTIEDNSVTGLLLDSRGAQSSFFINITDTVFRRNAYGIFLKSYRQNNYGGWVLERNTFEDNKFSGIRMDLYGHNTPDEVMYIANNKFIRNGVTNDYSAMSIDGKYQIQGRFIVEDNTFTGNGRGLDFKMSHTLVSPSLQVAVRRNTFSGSSGSYAVYLDIADLEFSGNTIETSTKLGVRIKRVFSNRFYNNIFMNPAAKYDLETLALFGNNVLINATYNYWGTSDPNRARSRVRGFSVNILYAMIDIFPLYTDSALTSLYTGDVGMGFTLANGKAGGKLANDITIPAHSQITVTSSIWIPPGVTLTIERNCTLLFLDERGIFVEGTFVGNGEKSGIITFGNAVAGSWTGFYITGLHFSLKNSVINGATQPILAIINTTTTSTVNLTSVNIANANAGINAVVHTRLSLLVTDCTFDGNVRGILAQTRDNSRIEITVKSSSITNSMQAAIGISSFLSSPAELIIQLRDSSLQNNSMALSLQSTPRLNSSITIDNCDIYGSKSRSIDISGWIDSFALRNSRLLRNVAGFGVRLTFREKCSMASIQNNVFSLSTELYIGTDTTSSPFLCPLNIVGNSFQGHPTVPTRGISIASNQFSSVRIASNDFSDIMGICLESSIYASLSTYLAEENRFFRCLVAVDFYNDQSANCDIDFVRNTFIENKGSQVITLESNPYQPTNLEFNKNVLRNNSGETVLSLKLPNILAQYNIFENPVAKYNVRFNKTGFSSEVLDFSNNRWGTNVIAEVKKTVFDKDKDAALPQISVEPFGEEPTCTGVENCSSSGTCIGPDECICDFGRQKPTCAETTTSTSTSTVASKSTIATKTTTSTTTTTTTPPTTTRTPTTATTTTTPPTTTRKPTTTTITTTPPTTTRTPTTTTTTTTPPTTTHTPTTVATTPLPRGEIGGVMHGDMAIILSRSPYTVTSDILVSPSGSLTIEAGVELHFPQSTGLRSQGKITILGNTSHPVKFLPTIAGQRWTGVRFEQQTGDPLSMVQNLLMNSTQSGLTVNGVFVQLNNVTSDYSSDSGFTFAWGPNPAVSSMTGLRARNNTKSGIYFNLGAAQQSLEITDCELMYNEDNGLLVTNISDLSISRCVISKSKRGILVNKRPAGKLDITSTDMYDNSENCIRVDAWDGNNGEIEFNLKHSSVSNHNTSLIGPGGALLGSTVINIGVVNNAHNVWNIVNNTFTGNYWNSYLISVNNKYLPGKAFNLTMTSNRFVENFSPILQAILGSGFKNTIKFEDNHVSMSRAAVSTVYFDGPSPKDLNVRVSGNIFDDIAGYCVVEYRGSNAVFDVELSGNSFTNSQVFNTICVQAYGIVMDDNMFMNPVAQCEISVPAFTEDNVFSAKRCYWGSSNLNNITERMCAFEKDMRLARVEYFPYRLSDTSKDLLSPSTAQFDTDGAYGGKIDGVVAVSQSVVIRRSIYIEEGGSLTIQPGVTLQFPLNTGIYAKGILSVGSLDGEKARLVPESTTWRGVYFKRSSRDQANDLRLMDSQYWGSGRVEILRQGQYGTICSKDFDALDAIVACRSFGYSQLDDVEFVSSNKPGSGPIWLSGLQCLGTENSLLECPHDDVVNTTLCTHAEDVIVSCYGGVDRASSELNDFSRLQNVMINDTEQGLRIDSLKVHMSEVELSNTKSTGVVITAPYAQFDFGGSVIRDSLYDGVQIQSLGSRGVANVTVLNSGNNGIHIQSKFGLVKVANVNVSRSSAAGINIMFGYDSRVPQSVIVEHSIVENHHYDDGLKIKTQSNLGPSFVNVRGNTMNNNTFGSVDISIASPRHLPKSYYDDRSLSIVDNVFAHSGFVTVRAVNNVGVKVEDNEFKSGGDKFGCLLLISTELFEVQRDSDSWKEVRVAGNTFNSVSGKCVVELKSPASEIFSGEFVNNNILQCSSSDASLMLWSSMYNLTDNSFNNPNTSIEVKVNPMSFAPNSVIHAENNWWGTTDLSEISARVHDQADDPSLYRLIVQPFRNGAVFDCSGVKSCNNNGGCVEKDTCSCYSGWTGTECDQPDCSAVNFCFLQGDCVGANKCDCHTGWSGPACDTAVCAAVKNCSSQGTCVTPDICECDAGFKGPDCSESVFVTPAGEIGGLVTGDILLSLSGSPYKVISDIRVPVDGSLTMQAGVEVLFQAGLAMVVQGRLMIMGNATHPVKFLPEREGVKWGGVRFEQAAVVRRDVTSGGPLSQMQHLVLNDTEHGLFLSGMYVQLDHVTSDYSAGSGFTFAWGPSHNVSSMTGLRARNNTKSGIYYNLGNAKQSLKITDCELMYNEDNGLLVTNISDLSISRCVISKSKRGILVNKRPAGKLDITSTDMYDNSENCIRVDAWDGNNGEIEFNLKHSSVSNHNTSLIGPGGALLGSTVINIGVVNNAHNVWNIVNNTFTGNYWNSYLISVNNKYLPGKAFNLTMTSNRFVENFSPILQAILGSGFKNTIKFEDNHVSMSRAAVSTVYFDGPSPKDLKVRVSGNIFDDIAGYCVVEYRGSNAVFDVELSGNSFTNGQVSNTICVQAYGIVMDDNTFVNPIAQCEISVPAFTEDNVFSAKRCYWGSSDLNNITERMCAFEKDMRLARVEYFPYRLSDTSKDLLSPSTAQFDTDGAYGGKIDGVVAVSQSVVIRRSIYIEEGGSLTIQPGVTLQFPLNTGIYAKGILSVGSLDGEKARLVPESNAWRGVYFKRSSRDQANDLRLMDSQYWGSGRVEILRQGQYGTICSKDFDALDAIVACRSFGYSQLDDVEFFSSNKPGSGPIWLSGLQCLGTENSLLECPHDDVVNRTLCTHAEDVIVSCYGGVDRASSELNDFSRLQNVMINDTEHGLRIDSLKVHMSEVELSNTKSTGVVITAPYAQFDFGGSVIRDSLYDGVQIQSLGSRGVANVTVLNSGNNGIHIQSKFGLVKVVHVNISSSSSAGINIKYSYDHLVSQSVIVENSIVENHHNDDGLKIKTQSNLGPSFVNVRGNTMKNNTVGSLSVEVIAPQRLQRPLNENRSVSIVDNVFEHGGPVAVWAVNNVSVEVENNEFKAGGDQSDCLLLVRAELSETQASTDKWRKVHVDGNIFNSVSGECVVELRSSPSEIFSGEFTHNNITQSYSSLATVRIKSGKYRLNDNNFDNPRSRLEAYVEVEHPGGSLVGSINAENNWWGTTVLSEIYARVYDREEDPDVYSLDVQPFQGHMIFDCSKVNSCSGRGDCIGQNTCGCHSGWAGPKCGEYDCADVSMCQGHGDCSGPNKCDCFSGWFGTTCETPICSSVNNCSSQGTCISPNSCRCDSGFQGANCTDVVPPTTISDQSVPSQNPTTGDSISKCERAVFNPVLILASCLLLIFLK
ncbi:uncharacterized protein LOC135464136 [Liolophura sinensis]|uniref:uncharacterized protein LOC135464136 n=1 Tax=Liolophura sinensis TaxID=3198878 RepID=UPI0031587EA4